MATAIGYTETTITIAAINGINFNVVGSSNGITLGLGGGTSGVTIAGGSDNHITGNGIVAESTTHTEFSSDGSVRVTYDDSNTQSWWRVESDYSGQVLASQTIQNRDSSHSVVVFNTGGSGNWSRYEDYVDPQGHQSVRDTYLQDGSIFREMWDVNNAAPWNKAEELYGADHKLQFIKGLEDNGSWYDEAITPSGVDPAGNVVGFELEVYDAAGHYLSGAWQDGSQGNTYSGFDAGIHSFITTASRFLGSGNSEGAGASAIGGNPADRFGANYGNGFGGFGSSGGAAGPGAGGASSSPGGGGGGAGTAGWAFDPAGSSSVYGGSTVYDPNSQSSYGWNGGIYLMELET